MDQINTAQVKMPLRIPRFNDISPSLMLLLAARASALGVFPFGAAFFAAAAAPFAGAFAAVAAFAVEKAANTKNAAKIVA